MKIAVVGAGAIGGYLGAKLSRSGQQVTFIARNRNLEAINSNGFKLILEDGSEELAPVGPKLRAVQRYADAGEQDVVLLTVKAHQVKDLLPDLRGLFGPQTMVVTMINGVPWWYFHKLAGPFEGRSLQSLDPDGLIAANIEPERLIGSVVYPASELVAPGVVKLIEGNRFSLGELDGSRSERIDALSKVMMAAHQGTVVSTTIRPTMLPMYMLAIRPQTNSFCSTKSMGPGCRPQISRPPSSTAAVGEPGMPSVSMGSSAAVPAAWAAVSGATTPSMRPLPKLFGSFDMRRAMP